MLDDFRQEFIDNKDVYIKYLFYKAGDCNRGRLVLCISQESSTY